MKFDIIRGWGVISELMLPAGGGIKIEFWERDSGGWLPARVLADISEEKLFTPANGEDETTNNYVGVGIIQADTIKNDRIFWSYHLDLRRYGSVKEATLKITTFETGGANAIENTMTVSIDAGDTLFLDNWTFWNGANVIQASKPLEAREIAEENELAGWVVDFSEVRMYQFLTIKKREKVAPLYFSPNLSGDYDLYIMVNNFAEFRLELPGIPYYEKIYLHPRNICWRTLKEIYVGRYHFGDGDQIGIHQSPGTIINPDHEFGDLGYIKLVKAETRVQTKKIDKAMEIAFYSEPLSIAYFGDLQNRKMARTLVQEYKALNVDRIFCQPGRCGSAMLYKSEIAKPAYPGLRYKHTGDDGQVSAGIAEMIENIDIMAELSNLCSKENIDFVISVGVNAVATYIRSRPLAITFTNENPHLAHLHYPYLFDFSHKEVRDYFCSWMEELTQYAIKGISLDYCRWPTGLTSDIMVILHREMKDRLGRKWDDLEISARFPVNDPVFHRAFEVWLKEDLIDLAIPANPFSCYPQMNMLPYVQLGHSFGKKVYAEINNFSKRHGKMISIIRPGEIKQLSEAYRSEGVDGLFFYQSEMIIEDVFLRRSVHNLNKKTAMPVN